MQQAHIYYSGEVQGVGFRYTARKFASSFSIKGWVKNLFDGRVEMLIEGSQTNIDEFCQKLEEYFKGYIEDKQIDYQNSEGQFKNFVIME